MSADKTKYAQGEMMMGEFDEGIPIGGGNDELVEYDVGMASTTTGARQSGVELLGSSLEMRWMCHARPHGHHSSVG
jgi:hypothetical protein